MRTSINLEIKKEQKKMKNELAKRSFVCDVKSEQTEKGTILRGRPIVYNSKTDLGVFEEIIETGALDSANLKDVRFLVNHDLSKIPLARSRNNNENSTMRLMVDGEGLKIEADLDIENNAEAKSLYSSVKRGDVSGMSFMFSIAGEKWENLDTDYPTRHITAIENVVEVSAVTFPAYDATEISTRDKNALDSARQTLDSALESFEKPLDSALEIQKLKNRNKAI